MSRFSDHCTVVTGGASGIGEATVRALVAEQGRVVIADLQEDRGRELVSELGSSVVFHKTDVTREDDIAGAIDVAQQSFGPLTGMVNNAGIVGAVGSVMDTSAEAFDHTMSILSRAVFLGIKLAARAYRCRTTNAPIVVHTTTVIVLRAPSNPRAGQHLTLGRGRGGWAGAVVG